MKMLYDLYETDPSLHLDDSHPYAKDMKQRYDRVKHSDLKDELLEFSLLKGMKQNIIQVYGTRDNFVDANIW